MHEECKIGIYHWERKHCLQSRMKATILFPEYFKSIISVSISPHYKIVTLVFLFHRWENRLRESKSCAKVTQLSLRVKIQCSHLDQASSPTPLLLFLLPEGYLLETNAGLMKNQMYVEVYWLPTAGRACLPDNTDPTVSGPWSLGFLYSVTEHSFTIPLYYCWWCFLVFVFFFFFGHTPQHVGPWFPDRGSNLCPLHWEGGVLITGPLGSLHSTLLYNQIHSTKTVYSKQQLKTSPYFT